MDMGDMKSKDLGNLMSKGLVAMGKQILENGGDFADIPQGAIPKAVKAQIESQSNAQSLLMSQEKARKLAEIVTAETLGPNKVE